MLGQHLLVRSLRLVRIPQRLAHDSKVEHDARNNGIKLLRQPLLRPHSRIRQRILERLLRLPKLALLELEHSHIVAQLRRDDRLQFLGVDPARLDVRPERPLEAALVAPQSCNLKEELRVPSDRPHALALRRCGGRGLGVRIPVRGEEAEDLVVELFRLLALESRVGLFGGGERGVGVDRGEGDEGFDAAGLAAEDRFEGVDGGGDVVCKFGG